MLTGISSPSSSHVQPCCLYTPQATEKDNHLKALVTTSNNFFTKTYQLQSLTNVLSTKPLIGASLSEPHIDKFAVESVILLYTYIVRRAVSHFQFLFCKFLRHSLIQKVFTNYSARRHKPLYLLGGNSKDGDHSWTYLFNDYNDRGYPMAKRFHLSMPLFALSL